MGDTTTILASLMAILLITIMLLVLSGGSEVAGLFLPLLIVGSNATAALYVADVLKAKA